MGSRLVLLVIGLLSMSMMVNSYDNIPYHIYLSLTGLPNTVQLTFMMTLNPARTMVTYCKGGQIGGSVENYGDCTNITITDSNRTFKFQRPAALPADFLTSVTLTNLARATLYHYRIIGDTRVSETVSKWFSYRTLPEDTDPVTLCLYGDLGSLGEGMMVDSYWSLPAITQRHTFDAIVHNGDLAYNLGRSRGQVGDLFLTNIQQMSAYAPYMVTPGNHEYHGDSILYYIPWFWGQITAGNHSGSTKGQLWWSSDVGPFVHIIGISTEAYCEANENIKEQWEWLQNDLEKARNRGAGKQPFIIVLGHRPMHFLTGQDFAGRLMYHGLQCTDSSRTNCNASVVCTAGHNCAYSISELILRYRVDIFNVGHAHTYIRHLPIGANWTYEVHPNTSQIINPKYPIHIVNGAAGVNNTDGLSRKRSVPASAPSGRENPPGVVGNSWAGYSVVKAWNFTHLHYQQIAANDGRIQDDFWIIKDPTQVPHSTVHTFVQTVQEADLSMCSD